MHGTPVAVLGGGLVGGFIARRLARSEWARPVLHDADARRVEEARAAGVDARRADLRDAAALDAACEGAELVIGALPGALGFAAARGVLERGRPLVDISFFPEEPWRLDAIARKRGVPAVVDCGLMPGLGGMLGVALADALDEPEELRILVGGLPVERRWPSEYKAPFSPADVIEEYTRPVRVRRGGREVVLPPLAEPELVEFPPVGTLEAFATDGLRSLVRTLPLPEMSEKTLRYPGHARLVEALARLGFFREEPLPLPEGPVSPRALTSALLFEDWRLEPEDEELTAMRVEVGGRRGGRALRLVAELFDRFDRGSGESSMARMTGLPALATARRIAGGELSAPGLLPAELLAREGDALARIVAALDEAGARLSAPEIPSLRGGPQTKAG